MKYIITKVYLVDATSAGEALRMLRIAAASGEEWVFQHEPDSVKELVVAKATGWLTILREQLFGRRKDDPRSVVL